MNKKGRVGCFKLFNKIFIRQEGNVSLTERVLIICFHSIVEEHFKLLI